MTKQYFEYNKAIEMVIKLNKNESEGWKYEIEIDETNNKYCLIRIIDEDGILVDYYSY